MRRSQLEIRLSPLHNIANSLHLKNFIKTSLKFQVICSFFRGLYFGKKQVHPHQQILSKDLRLKLLFTFLDV
jgi:hypothetical protein